MSPSPLQVDLAVIGAGLSGCGLLARLSQRGYSGRVALVEAGRGPGGRMATRRSLEPGQWRLDHGSPLLQLSSEAERLLEPLLAPLHQQGVLHKEHCSQVALDASGAWLPLTAAESGHSWRGAPDMSAIAGALLNRVPAAWQRLFGVRIRHLQRQQGRWLLRDAEGTLELEARQLVLSGTLLAHPRSLAMLAWPDVPLREAVAEGMDPQLDAALAAIALIEADVRWNLMLALPSGSALAQRAELPRQLIFTAAARQRWGLDRLVFQPQADGRLGVVLHGLGQADQLPQDQQQRLLQVWQELEQVLVGEQSGAEVLGLMRWGASQPTAGALPSELRWCAQSEVGFCGDWLTGPGYGSGEGALRSAFELAERLLEQAPGGSLVN